MTQTAKPHPRVLCIGIPVRDLTFRIEAVPGRGYKVPASAYQEICGGNALNAAIGIARLGGTARMCGPMGDKDEAAATFIFDKLAEEGIATSELVHMPGLVTPISAVLVDPTGERTIVTFRDPKLWDVELPSADELLADCDAIMIESRCASFATPLCAEARKRDIPVVVDIDSAMSLNQGLLTASSHLIFSAEALHATAGIEDDEASLKKVAALTHAFVAVTRGPKGTLWLDDKQQFQETPAYPVHVVDTLGAGDIFHGGFAVAFSEGQDIPSALRFASAAAALKCTRPGGAFACPSRAEVEAFLAEKAK
ncbi:sugar kinase [Rhodopseudomonas palustris]|uniref:Sugar kinase n=1 Tax=Rhodopseudomonas palustris TaxID=1076 RepID=A0A418VLA3_RHOPL|nr:sugar kinase [Rhodopseudomonas palustris]RJF76943.1 sugar kinase [Rhodopseudomonas palustris]